MRLKKKILPLVPQGFEYKIYKWFLSILMKRMYEGIVAGTDGKMRRWHPTSPTPYYELLVVHRPVSKSCKTCFRPSTSRSCGCESASGIRVMNIIQAQVLSFDTMNVEDEDIVIEDAVDSMYIEENVNYIDIEASPSSISSILF